MRQTTASERDVDARDGATFLGYRHLFACLLLGSGIANPASSAIAEKPTRASRAATSQIGLDLFRADIVVQKTAGDSRHFIESQRTHFLSLLFLRKPPVPHHGARLGHHLPQ